MKPLLAAVVAIVIGIGIPGPSDADDLPPGMAEAVFAGGCFWCMEPPFDKLPGVVSTTSGYIGGAVEKPTYQQVSAGGTGHAEAVAVVYDPAKVSYATLLDVFWRNIDPFDPAGQFCDKGDQYRSEIFWRTDEQKDLALRSKQAVEKLLGRPVATRIESAATFWPAEDYHQDYYQKSSLKYQFYRYSCGRDSRLDEVWKDHPRLSLDLGKPVN